jgi:ribosomal protein S15P/S13E
MEFQAKLVGKKISRILRENNVQFEGLKEVTEKRVESLKSHMGKNKHDHHRRSVVEQAPLGSS